MNTRHTLVAFCSATGTTERIAWLVTKQIKARLHEIRPEKPYTLADLDYENPKSRTSLENADPDSRPAITSLVKKMERYGTVFLGYPLWWGQAPKVVHTFLDGYDFGGKTVVPFCTSGSSPVGDSVTELRSLVADSATWLSGVRFSGQASAEEVWRWVDGLELADVKRA